MRGVAHKPSRSRGPDNSGQAGAGLNVLNQKAATQVAAFWPIEDSMRKLAVTFMLQRTSLQELFRERNILPKFMRRLKAKLSKANVMLRV